jgi:hypothetical protein
MSSFNNIKAIKEWALITMVVPSSLLEIQVLRSFE